MKPYKHYINLTNGIDYIDELSKCKFIYKFVRIESTACEQHLWDKVIHELDYNFLLDLALGYNVVVYDTSVHKDTSRAIYQGLEFIKFVLNLVWFNKKIEIKIHDNNHMNCTNYFMEEYKKLKDSTIKKIKYVKKFLNTDKIFLIGASKHTKFDGNYEHYKNKLIKYYK